MTIPMQGSWTVSVKSRSAAFPQRFIIDGADTGNGTYNGVVTTAPVFVTGANWRIRVQNDPGGGFVNSADQIKFPTVSTGNYRFDIETDDAGGDGDFNDLILTCSTPVTQTDFIIYGSATSYSGRCFFPCWPGWLVIDTEATLSTALEYLPIRRAIERIYPERIIKKPIPQPDPPPFVPMLIPLSGDRLLPEKRAQVFRVPQEEVRTELLKEALNVREQSLSLRTVALQSFADRVTFDLDRLGIASIIDRSAFFCSTEKLAGFPISFEEYDRSAAELSGGPYTGTGPREDLGLTITDRNGNYIFRFSRSIDEFFEERDVDVATGEDEVVQRMPDLIAKLLDSMAPGGVAFESAPYWNVPVLKRINLCFRKPVRSGCQGGRNIQQLGAIRMGLASTVFDADGRITCTDTSLADVPQARCAAWAGSVRLFGCFLDSERPVKYYTIRHRRRTATGFDDWQFYQEGMFLRHMDFDSPQPIGPFDRDLEVVNGSDPVRVKAYDNIEQDEDWAASEWTFKALINTAGGTPAYAPTPGPVQFEIQGYDAAGNFVEGATDSVLLYIDNTGVQVDLQSVQMGTQVGDACALFHLSGEPDPAVLTVRFKAVQHQGFLNGYSLAVRKGNFPPPFGIASTFGPSGEAPRKIADAYSHVDAVSCARLFGTKLPHEPHADAANYVTAYIIPEKGNWLDPGQPFCTFAVSISASMRVTDGTNPAIAGAGPDTYLLGIEA